MLAQECRHKARKGRNREGANKQRTEDERANKRDRQDAASEMQIREIARVSAWLTRGVRWDTGMCLLRLWIAKVGKQYETTHTEWSRADS